MYADSTLRAIFIAAATFDPDVKNPDVMNFPPVVTPLQVRENENERKKLLKTLSNCSAPIQWSTIPDKLTNMCLMKLEYSFRKSNEFYSFSQGNGTFKVVHATKEKPPLLVCENSDQKLVCLSCYFF